MGATYLLILSSTMRQNPDPEALPAIQRYEGLYPAILKSLQNKGQFPKCDVIFVTGQGIVTADEKIVRSDTRMTPALAASLRKKNLEALERLFAAKTYQEIYVNLGRSYLKSIEGFEKLTSSKITCATGVLGKKAVHMKKWGLDHSSQTS